MSDYLYCRSCRRSQEIRRGPEDELALKDDITQLRGKVERTESPGLRDVLARRIQRGK